MCKMNCQLAKEFWRHPKWVKVNLQLPKEDDSSLLLRTKINITRTIISEAGLYPAYNIGVGIRSWSLVCAAKCCVQRINSWWFTFMQSWKKSSDTHERSGAYTIIWLIYMDTDRLIDWVILIYPINFVYGSKMALVHTFKVLDIAQK